MLILAAAEIDPLSGGAGWIGAGLLGMVLAWLLLKHLPEKDRLITGLMTDKDARMAEQRTDFSRTLNELTSLFRQEASAERMSCEKHFQTLADSIANSFKVLGDQLQNHSLRNQQWLDILRKEVDARLKEGHDHHA